MAHRLTSDGGTGAVSRTDLTAPEQAKLDARRATARTAHADDQRREELVRGSELSPETVAALLDGSFGPNEIDQAVRWLALDRLRQLGRLP